MRMSAQDASKGTQRRRRRRTDYRRPRRVRGRFNSHRTPAPVQHFSSREEPRATDPPCWKAAFQQAIDMLRVDADR